MSPTDRIGSRIRRARERLHLTQDDLAAKVGVSRSAINAWERDRSYPKNRIGALEAVLGVQLAGEATASPRPEYPGDPALQAIWDLPAYDEATGEGLTDDEKRGLIALAVAMRAQRRAVR